MWSSKRTPIRDFYAYAMWERCQLEAREHGCNFRSPPASRAQRLFAADLMLVAPSSAPTSCIEGCRCSMCFLVCRCRSSVCYEAAPISIRFTRVVVAELRVQQVMQHLARGALVVARPRRVDPLS